jgi:hypothetical protein
MFLTTVSHLARRAPRRPACRAAGASARAWSRAVSATWMWGRGRAGPRHWERGNLPWYLATVGKRWSCPREDMRVGREDKPGKHDGDRDGQGIYQPDKTETFKDYGRGRHERDDRQSRTIRNEATDARRLEDKRGDSPDGLA